MEKVTYLKSVQNPRGVEHKTIQEIYELIIGDTLRNATTQCHLLAKKYREAEPLEIEKAKENYRRAKTSGLPALVSSGEYSYKNNDGCTKYAPQITLDIDNISNEKTLVLVKEYFKKDLATILMYISPSGLGLKVVQLVNYNNEDPQKFHKIAFNYLSHKHNKFLKKHGLEIDASGSDLSRASFLVYDKKAYFNPNPMPSEVLILGDNTNTKALKKGHYNSLETDPEENIALIEDIVQWAESQKIDITTTSTKRDNWVSIMYALKNSFSPENGRAYFISLSRPYILAKTENFLEIEKKTKDCEKMWDKCNPRDSMESPATIGTILFYAKEKGYVPAKKICISKSTFFNSLTHDLEKHNLVLRYETDSKILEMKGEKIWVPVDDKTLGYIRLRVFNGRVTKFDIVDVLTLIVPAVSARAEFMNGLPKWDGVDRLDALADTLICYDETPIQKTLRKIYVKKWFVSTIAQLHSDGYDGQKNENIIVLHGGQYIGKTRWCEGLLPQEWKHYFLSGAINPKNKDSLIMLSRLFIMFLDEGISINSKNVKEIKALTSTSSFFERAAYGTFAGRYTRTASFIASTNDEKILSDLTGNRRYWCIKTDKIVHNHDIDMFQVWAQALTLFKEGYQYWLTDAEFKDVSINNENFEVDDILGDSIKKLFVQDPAHFLSSADVFEIVARHFSDNKIPIPKHFNLINIGRFASKYFGGNTIKFIEGKTKRGYNIKPRVLGCNYEIDTTGYNILNNGLFNN